MFIYIFEFFNESGNFLEYVLFFGEILWIKWVYFRQNGIEFSIIVIGKFLFQ